MLRTESQMDDALFRKTGAIVFVMDAQSDDYTEARLSLCAAVGVTALRERRRAPSPCAPFSF